eukprot:15195672-Ditylum_brightwellii.AAC.1
MKNGCNCSIFTLFTFLPNLFLCGPYFRQHNKKLENVGLCHDESLILVVDDIVAVCAVVTDFTVLTDKKIIRLAPG